MIATMTWLLSSLRSAAYEHFVYDSRVRRSFGQRPQPVPSQFFPPSAWAACHVQLTREDP